MLVHDWSPSILPYTITSIRSGDIIRSKKLAEKTIGSCFYAPFVVRTWLHYLQRVIEHSCARILGVFGSNAGAPTLRHRTQSCTAMGYYSGNFLYFGTQIHPTPRHSRVAIIFRLFNPVCHLHLANILCDPANVCIGNSFDRRHITKAPVVAGHAISCGTCNCSVATMAQYVQFVN